MGALVYLLDFDFMLYFVCKSECYCSIEKTVYLHIFEKSPLQLSNANIEDILLNKE